MTLGCLAGVEYKGKILFSPMYSNGLFELDMYTRTVRLVRIVENEKCVAALYRKAILYKSEAWFVPQKGEFIICVNLETYEIKYINLEYATKYSESGKFPYYYTFIDAVIVNDKYLVCVPIGIDSIMLINMETHEVCSVKDISNPNLDKVHTSFLSDEKLCVISQNGLLDKEIEIESKESFTKEWEFDSKRFSSGLSYKNELFLIPNNSSGEKPITLGKINLLTKEILYYPLPDTTYGYYGGLVGEGFLLLFPDNGSRILRFDLSDEQFYFIDYPEEIRNKVTGDKTIIRAIDSKSRILVSMPVEGYILEFDTNGDIKDYFNVAVMQDEEKNSIIEASREKGENISGLITESISLMLSDFLYILSYK